MTRKWLLSLLVAGCNFNANSAIDGTFDIALGSIDNSCNTSGDTTDQNGHTTWTKMIKKDENPSQA
jgi:hypothetical protein